MNLRCQTCGQTYSQSHIEKSGPDNECCVGNLSTWKGAQPDQETTNKYLLKGVT